MVENGKREEKWVSSTAEGQEEDHDNIEKLKPVIDEREDEDVNGEKEGKEENAEYEDENEDNGESGYKDGTYNGEYEEEENEQAGQDQEEEEEEGDDDYEDEVESKANWRNQAVTKDEDDVNEDETGDGDHLGKEGTDDRKKKSNFLENDKAFGQDAQPAKKKVKGLGHEVCFE